MAYAYVSVGATVPHDGSKVTTHRPDGPRPPLSTTSRVHPLQLPHLSIVARSAEVTCRRLHFVRVYALNAIEGIVGILRDCRLGLPKDHLRRRTAHLCRLHHSSRT